MNPGWVCIFCSCCSFKPRVLIMPPSMFGTDGSDGCLRYRNLLYAPFPTGGGRLCIIILIGEPVERALSQRPTCPPVSSLWSRVRQPTRRAKTARRPPYRVRKRQRDQRHSTRGGT